MAVDVPQGRCNDHAAGQAADVAVGRQTHQLCDESHKQPANTDLVVQSFLGHFAQHLAHQRCKGGVLLRRKHPAPAVQQAVQQAGVRQGIQCKKGAQQFLGVAEQIGPLACRARVRPCRMGHITGDDRDIPRVKILNMAGKIYLTAVTFAKADLQTVVEVQHPAGDIRDTPVLTCDDAHREM